MIVLEDLTTHPPKGATVRSRKSGNLATVVSRRRTLEGEQPVYWVTVDTGVKQAEVRLESIEYPVESALGSSGLQVSDRVTNDKDWTGTVTAIEAGFSLSEDSFYYLVHWQERADHESSLVRKQPICGHLKQEIRSKTA